ncbi:MAG: MazG family protein [Candidatus Aenigmarchaeota archaeon]|nr:MazG family protein [Candidatus Aenigmarchaeota archaeon]
MAKKVNIEDLWKLIQVLRGENGCPWDRRQTLDSFKKYVIEETKEVIEAIDAKKPEQIKEELGDLLWDVLFLAKIAEDEGLFKLEDVVKTVYEKMVRRHPHVFGNVKVRNTEEVRELWKRIKKQERSLK